MRATAFLVPNEPMAALLTVYFDGACPLCRREIAYYQALDTAGRMAWQDVSADAAYCVDGRCQADLMRRFHVRAADGRWWHGAAAFARLWQALPGAWHWAGRLAALPPLVWVLELAYRAFLPLRPWLQQRARHAHDARH